MQEQWHEKPYKILYLIPGVSFNILLDERKTFLLFHNFNNAMIPIYSNTNGLAFYQAAFLICIFKELEMDGKFH
jgi:hypothetical protein